MLIAQCDFEPNKSRAALARLVKKPFEVWWRPWGTQGPLSSTGQGQLRWALSRGAGHGTDGHRCWRAGNGWVLSPFVPVSLQAIHQQEGCRKRTLWEKRGRFWFVTHGDYTCLCFAVSGLPVRCTPAHKFTGRFLPVSLFTASLTSFTSCPS